MVLSIRQFMSLLVTAVMLAATSVPPAMRHAHAGGAQPHDHAQTEDHAHLEEHGHGHHHHGDGSHSHRHHSHDDGVPEKEEAPVTSVGHLHFTWLGFPFTLPQRSPNPEEDAPVDETGAFVRLISDEWTLSSQPSRLAEPLILPSDFGSSTDETANATTASAAAHVPAHSLLCDVARRVRSGVLLI